MKYKAFFLNLDGMLLRSDGEISEASQKSILLAQGKGIYIVN
jgi:hydroxymethylpyrimidine pyrophosphatase-like HAD family hydrolase